jgi:CRISPR-associated protein Cas1
VAWQLKRWITAAEKVGSVEELLGLEGAASAAYFRCFGGFLKERFGFDFEKRTRRPPGDPVNALLSLAYTLVLGDLVSACHVVGLDPYVGYLHTPRYGRASLALDLLEEFRPIVADSLVVSFINNGSVAPADFEVLHGGYFLKEAARKRFYEAYERRKAEEITHPVFEYRLPYRRAYELQARILAKYLVGEIERYEPLVVR